MPAFRWKSSQLWRKSHGKGVPADVPEVSVFRPRFHPEFFARFTAMRTGTSLIPPNSYVAHVPNRLRMFRAYAAQVPRICAEGDFPCPCSTAAPSL
jgi:hypothetical protein